MSSIDVRYTIQRTLTEKYLCGYLWLLTWVYLTKHTENITNLKKHQLLLPSLHPGGTQELFRLLSHMNKKTRLWWYWSKCSSWYKSKWWYKSQSRSKLWYQSKSSWVKQIKVVIQITMTMPVKVHQVIDQRTWPRSAVITALYYSQLTTHKW